MNDLWIMVISTILSRGIFSFLFYIFNYKVCGIFNSLQSDLAKLSRTNRRILNLTGHFLSIVVAVLIGVRLDFDRVVVGLMLGFLSALVDICFGDTIIDGLKNEKN